MRINSLVMLSLGAVEAAQGANGGGTKLVKDIKIESVNSWNGAAMKVSGGKVVSAKEITSNDPGFYIPLENIKVNGAKYLEITLKGVVVQKDQWDKYGSIQVQNEDGETFILRELCKGSHADCADWPKTKPSEIEKGITLILDLPKGLTTLSKVTIVFIGKCKVEAGFTISDIKLTK